MSCFRIQHPNASPTPDVDPAGAAGTGALGYLKNDSACGAGDGTSLDATWLNPILFALNELMNEAGVNCNTVAAGQEIVEAIRNLIPDDKYLDDVTFNSSTNVVTFVMNGTSNHTIDLSSLDNSGGGGTPTVPGLTDVGSVINAWPSSGAVGPGGTVAGSQLFYSDTDGSQSLVSSVGVGTWRCHGRLTGAAQSSNTSTIFLRIS